MTKLRAAALLFGVQLVSYGVICINTRAISAVDYPTALWSDFLIASLNFFVIRRIALEADSLHLWAGYVSGSLVGTALGINLSTRFTS